MTYDAILQYRKNASNQCRIRPVGTELYLGGSRRGINQKVRNNWGQSKITYHFLVFLFFWLPCSLPFIDYLGGQKTCSPLAL